MNAFTIVCYIIICGIIFVTVKGEWNHIYRKFYSKKKMKDKFLSLATYFHSLNKEGKFDRIFTGEYKGYYVFKVENNKFLCAKTSNGDYLYAVEITDNIIPKYVQWKVINEEICITSYEDYFFIRKFDKNFRFIFDNK